MQKKITKKAGLFLLGCLLVYGVVFRGIGGKAVPSLTLAMIDGKFQPIKIIAPENMKKELLSFKESDSDSSSYILAIENGEPIHKKINVPKKIQRISGEGPVALIPIEGTPSAVFIVIPEGFSAEKASRPFEFSKIDTKALVEQKILYDTPNDYLTAEAMTSMIKEGYTARRGRVLSEKHECFHGYDKSSLIMLNSQRINQSQVLHAYSFACVYSGAFNTIPITYSYRCLELMSDTDVIKLLKNFERNYICVEDVRKLMSK